MKRGLRWYKATARSQAEACATRDAAGRRSVSVFGAEIAYVSRSGRRVSMCRSLPAGYDRGSKLFGVNAMEGGAVVEAAIVTTSRWPPWIVPAVARPTLLRGRGKPCAPRVGVSPVMEERARGAAAATRQPASWARANAGHGRDEARSPAPRGHVCPCDLEGRGLPRSGSCVRSHLPEASDAVRRDDLHTQEGSGLRWAKVAAIPEATRGGRLYTTGRPDSLANWRSSSVWRGVRRVGMSTWMVT